ncbi:hypothetical protein PMAYCL1PPCAC_10499, partial [Pristionchus mayeri]
WDTDRPFIFEVAHWAWYELMLYLKQAVIDPIPHGSVALKALLLVATLYPDVLITSLIETAYTGAMTTTTRPGLPYRTFDELVDRVLAGLNNFAVTDQGFSPMFVCEKMPGQLCDRASLLNNESFIHSKDRED